MIKKFLEIFLENLRKNLNKIIRNIYKNISNTLEKKSLRNLVMFRIFVLYSIFKVNF